MQPTEASANTHEMEHKLGDLLSPFLNSVSNKDFGSNLSNK